MILFFANCDEKSIIVGSSKTSIYDSGGELMPEQAAFDVNFYDLNLRVEPEKKWIGGSLGMICTATKPLDVVVLQLDTLMKISRISGLKGSDLKWKHIDGLVIIYPDKPVKVNNRFFAKIEYSGHPLEAKEPKRFSWSDGFYWAKTESGLPWIGNVSVLNGADIWWPCKDHPSDEPDSMAINITVPSDLMCVSSGQLKEIRDAGNGKTEYRWFVNNPINNYNISVNIGHYTVIQDTIHSLGKVRDATYYVLDYNETVAREHFKEARTVIRVLEHYFGPYQWWEDGYKLVQAPYLGMEHQTAVTYGNKFRIYDKSKSRNIYGFIDYIILHETAHEWWGNSITACDPADVWIHEGFGTYTEVLYVEYLLGYDLSIDYFIQKRRGIGNRKAIVGPRNQNYWGFSDAYNKGAWIIHTLRNVIDDNELFFKTLKGFAVDNAKGIVCTEDVRDYFAEKTGIDLTKFFDQYLFNRKIPILEYAQENGQFYYRWVGAINEFDMPINLLVNKSEKRIYPTIVAQSISIPEYATVEVKDWEYLIIKKENEDLLTSAAISASN